MANGVQYFPTQKVHERNAFWNKGRLVFAVFDLFGKGVKREKGIEKAKICTDWVVLCNLFYVFRPVTRIFKHAIF